MDAIKVAICSESREADWIIQEVVETISDEFSETLKRVRDIAPNKAITEAVQSCIAGYYKNKESESLKKFNRIVLTDRCEHIINFIQEEK